MKAGIVVAALLASTLAHSAEPVRLEFDRVAGAEKCPDRHTFEAIVAARVESAIWSPAASRVVRVVFYESEPRGPLAGRMELLEGAAMLGVREARSTDRDCREIAETLALTVALAIDPPELPKPSKEKNYSGELLDQMGRSATDPVVWDVLSPPASPHPPTGADGVPHDVMPAVRTIGRPIPLMLFAGAEGGYSYWSGGSRGPDDRFMTIAWSGDFVAGGEAPLANGYLLDVLITGYSANRSDRRDVTDFERAGRGGSEAHHVFVNQSIGATAMRGAVRYESEQTAVSLGMLIGGFRQSGCHHARVEDWQSALCADLQKWAALPTFGARLGPTSGPYASVGFLDRRFLGGEIAHLGVGAILSGDRRVDTSLVASAEGVGARLQLELPVGRRLVLMPALSGGILYDTFGGGGSNSWIRTGIAVAARR